MTEDEYKKVIDENKNKKNVEKYKLLERKSNKLYNRIRTRILSYSVIPNFDYDYFYYDVQNKKDDVLSGTSETNPILKAAADLEKDFPFFKFTCTVSHHNDETMLDIIKVLLYNNDRVKIMIGWKYKGGNNNG